MNSKHIQPLMLPLKLILKNVSPFSERLPLIIDIHSMMQTAGY